MLSNTNRGVRSRWTFTGLHCAFQSMFLLLSAPAAHSLPVFCDGGAASVPVMDPLSTSAAIGDYTLTCSGGAAADPSLFVTIQSILNTSLLQNVAPTLTDGTNVYTGTFTGASAVSFVGVSLNPFASRFSIRDIFVDASLLAENFQVVEFVSFGSPDVLLSNPQQFVASNGAVAINVPEPGSAGLLCLGLAAALLFRRRFAPHPPTHRHQYSAAT